MYHSSQPSFVFVFLVLRISPFRRLYHRNPWMDTAKGVCPLFDQYLSNQTNFFIQRFTGMTLPVATFLVENVFCILDDLFSPSHRIDAREFGIWVRDLPTLLTASQPGTRTHPSKAHSSKMLLFMDPIQECEAQLNNRRMLHPDVRDYEPLSPSRLHTWSNHMRTRRAEYSAPRFDSNPSSTCGDVSVGNDEHDNGEEFFTASARSTNGPRSSKTASYSLLSMLVTQTI